MSADGAPASGALNIDAVRAQFPILARDIHGAPLVYLDNAASAQKPRAVIDAMARAMETRYANVHRGLHTLSNEATGDFEAARGKVAAFLNAPSPDNIVFTSGGTDAMNLVAYALGVDRIGEGDEIILTVMEHHSNIVPWHFLRERKGAILKWAEVDEDGLIDLDQYRALFSKQTKIVAISAMSNVFGAPTQARALTRIAHENDALIFFDGCQAAVHGAVDVQAIGCDFFAITGHKLYGPSGVGALYGTTEALGGMAPFRGGGEMIDVVARDRVTYNEPPHRFEAGTPPIVEAIGLGAALDWMVALGMDAIAAHESALAAHAGEELRKLNFARVFGAAPDKAPIFAFALDGAHPHDVSTILDRKGVAIRAGHHCCQPLMERLGVSATSRASFGVYNTHAEVDALIEALKRAHTLFA